MRIKPIIGSTVGESMLFLLLDLKLADLASPQLCRWWVSATPDSCSGLLIRHLSLCSQSVALIPDFKLSSLIKTLVSAESELLLFLAPFQGCWLSPLLGSAVCELLLYLRAFHVCWSSSPLALQTVSCCCPWHPFMPADQPLPWLCRQWVAAIHGTLSCLLTSLSLGSADSELLLSMAPFHACWSSPPLTLQHVSCCCS